jgi:hypothetical protein
LEASHQLQKNLNDDEQIKQFRGTNDGLRKLEASIASGRPEVGITDFVATYLKQGSFSAPMMELLKQNQPGYKNVADAIKIELGKGTDSSFVKELQRYLTIEKQSLAKQIVPQVQRLDAEAKMAGYRGIKDFSGFSLEDISGDSTRNDAFQKVGKKVK